jgi:hypothetical protein
MMAAVAHSHDDEPIDLAEAEMPEADFRIIERAHQLCDHAPARELTAEPEFDSHAARVAKLRIAGGESCLISHATKILRAQFRAGQLTVELQQQRAEQAPSSQEDNSHQCEFLGAVEMADEPADEVEFVTDWALVAADAWNAKGWKDAAVEYRVKRGNTCARMRR